MDFTLKDDAGVRVVGLAGELTFEASDSFREMIGTLDSTIISGCVLDLSALEFIDSAGLGLLVLANATAKRAGVALSMRHPQGQVREMIETAEFHTIIPCTF